MDDVHPGGWLTFAGVVLMVGGIMRFFDAIWAFSYHGSVQDDLTNAIFGHSLKTYAWVYLIVAIVLFISGIGVMLRSQIFRWIGIVAGGLTAITATAWLPYYPVWSLTFIVIGLLIIYALAAHGQREPAS